MHHIESPRTDDSAIEQEIQAKGLTAPRVTPEDVTANIRNVYFFTAKQGAERALNEEFQEPVDIASSEELSLLTICVIVTKSGFTAVGTSACASPENFDAGVGKKIAFENTKQQLWPLMGYELKQRLFAALEVEEARLRG